MHWPQFGLQPFIRWIWCSQAAGPNANRAHEMKNMSTLENELRCIRTKLIKNIKSLTKWTTLITTQFYTLTHKHMHWTSNKPKKMRICTRRCTWNNRRKWVGSSCLKSDRVRLLILIFVLFWGKKIHFSWHSHQTTELNNFLWIVWKRKSDGLPLDFHSFSIHHSCSVNLSFESQDICVVI